MMTSTRPTDSLGGEARVALRGAALAWIVMGLLTTAVNIFKLAGPAAFLF
jgi:hypothetical protein